MLEDYLSKPMFQKIDNSTVPVSEVAEALKAYLSETKNKVLADTEAVQFYLLTHAYQLLRARKQTLPLTALEREFMEVHLDCSGKIAQRAFYYTYIVCCREMRHHSVAKASKGYYKILEESVGVDGTDLIKKIGTLESSGVFDEIRNYQGKASIGSIVTALRKTFTELYWKNGYGGVAWGAVAQCLEDFTFGRASPELFVDMVWTLCHNNGPIFNKPYLYSGYKKSLINILDVQRAGLIPQLLWDFKQGHKYITYGVQESIALYDKILKCLDYPGLRGHIDWGVVKSLGATQDCVSFINQQETMWGIIAPVNKATNVKFFFLSPSVKLKKIKREAFKNYGGV